MTGLLSALLALALGVGLRGWLGWREARAEATKAQESADRWQARNDLAEAKRDGAESEAHRLRARVAGLLAALEAERRPLPWGEQADPEATTGPCRAVEVER